MRLLRSTNHRILLAALVAGTFSLGTGIAAASQPDMTAALNELHAAQNHLERIHQNKGGHAQAARRLVAQAIGQVEAGIRVGHEHGE